MAGRKPLPLAIKQIKGTVQKCRTNPHEPRPTTALCTPPEYMSDVAKEAWNYAVANSPPGLLSALDGAVLIAVARLVQHQRTGGMSAGCWGTTGHSGLFPTHSKN